MTYVRETRRQHGYNINARKAKLEAIIVFAQDRAANVRETCDGLF